MSWAGYFKNIKPSSPQDGDQWINNNGFIYVWLECKKEWVQMSGQPAPPPIVTLKELVDLYPDLKELVDKYTEWEILKRTGKQNDSIQ